MLNVPSKRYLTAIYTFSGDVLPDFIDYIHMKIHCAKHDDRSLLNDAIHLRGQIP